MKTSSAKAKGRRLQQWVRDKLLGMAGPQLQPGDIESRGMGQNGVDVVMSPRAWWLFPFAIECKNVEKLNVVTTFLEHADKYKHHVAHDPNAYDYVKPLIPILVHSKNRNPRPMVTMYLEDFFNVWESKMAVNMKPTQG